MGGGLPKRGAPKDRELWRNEIRNLQSPPSLKSLGNQPRPEGQLAKSRRRVESGICTSPKGL